MVLWIDERREQAGRGSGRGQPPVCAPTDRTTFYVVVFMLLSGVAQWSSLFLAALISSTEARHVAGA